MKENHDGSAKVIFVALFANLGIAVAKFFGGFISGSSSLLAEAVHSLVDCANQVFLLIGNKKSQKPADLKHPLGYGREAFFWSFMVAIFLFSLGGLFAMYEGFHKIHDEGELSHPLLGLGILVLSLIMEGYSFIACLKEIRLQNNHKNLWKWFQNTKNSELLVIFTEDAAAMVGLIIATVCLAIAWATGQNYWDAMGSILVGILLVIVAALLAVEVKSFIIGEAASEEYVEFVSKNLSKYFPGGRVLNFIAIQTGSNEVMISYKIEPGIITDVATAIKLVNELERATKNEFSSIRWQFVELDDHA